MNTTDVLVVGGGPAGLSAALAVAKRGLTVVLADRQTRLGGQLIKQTHKFFGSRSQRAGHRGVEIASDFESQILKQTGIEVLSQTEVLGYYPDGVVTMDQSGAWTKIRPQAIVVATGASEKPLAFPNCDLPGVYGAGAVQTIMNLYGIMPGSRALMVGAGNIGLIVSYQLTQAGVEVVAVVEAAPHIGGYAVHASKIRRMGIPILCSHVVKAALGNETLEKAVIWRVDQAWKGMPGTETEFAIDILCLAVGLSPTTDLLWQMGCAMAFVPELGGHVPLLDAEQQTSVPGIFVAGDAAGAEEASSAMMTGRIAGLAVAKWLGKGGGVDQEISETRDQLAALRAGPTGEKVRSGLRRMAQAGGGRAC